MSELESTGAILLKASEILPDLIEQEKKIIKNMRKISLIPGLAMITVGSDAATKIYVRNKQRMCDDVGVFSKVIAFPEDAPARAVLREIERLNRDVTVHAILVQLPLPYEVKQVRQIMNAIAPEKDVDCLGDKMAGTFYSGHTMHGMPCTAAGIMQLIASTGIELDGKHAVVIGRSIDVGQAVAKGLLNENCTVTVCHRHTVNLPEITKAADILVTATGRPGLVTGDMVKPGAVVIDAGISRTEDGKVVGDVDFESVQPVASFLTPVPGGVGPMTIFRLIQNTCYLAMKYGHRPYTQQLTPIEIQFNSPEPDDDVEEPEVPDENDNSGEVGDLC